MQLENIGQQNLHALAKMMLSLWPDTSYQEEYKNCCRILELQEQQETCILLKEAGAYVGFIQLSKRQDYEEGTMTSPVAYIEGIYIKKRHRNKGFAKILVEAGANWGRANACKEYASDTEWDNEASIAFHNKVGFKKVSQIVCFVKSLDGVN